MQEMAKFCITHEGKDYHYQVFDHGYVFFAYVIPDATSDSPCYFPDAILMVRKGKWEIDNFEEEIEVLEALAKEIFTWQLSIGKKLMIDSESPHFVQRFSNRQTEISASNGNISL